MLENLEKQDLIDIIKSQGAYIKTLEGQVPAATADNKPKEAQQKPVIPPPVTIDGKLYKFSYPAFKFEGVSCRADLVQYDENLLRAILAKKNQTILKQIV